MWRQRGGCFWPSHLYSGEQHARTTQDFRCLLTWQIAQNRVHYAGNHLNQGGQQQHSLRVLQPQLSYRTSSRVCCQQGRLLWCRLITCDSHRLKKKSCVLNKCVYVTYTYVCVCVLFWWLKCVFVILCVYIGVIASQTLIWIDMICVYIHSTIRKTCCSSWAWTRRWPFPGRRAPSGYVLSTMNTHLHCQCGFFNRMPPPCNE